MQEKVPAASLPVLVVRMEPLISQRRRMPRQTRRFPLAATPQVNSDLSGITAATVLFRIHSIVAPLKTIVVSPCPKSTSHELGCGIMLMEGVWSVTLLSCLFAVEIEFVKQTT